MTWLIMLGGKSQGADAAEGGPDGHTWRDREVFHSPVRPMQFCYAAKHAHAVPSVIWDAAVVLSKLLEHQCEALRLPNSRCVEIGAGCGLVGVAAAILGAEVAITDRNDESTLAMITSNVEANVPTAQRERVTVTELTWGETKPGKLQGPDYVLSSDPLVCEGCITPLVQCLVSLCHDWPKTKVTNEPHHRKRAYA